jgi:hypothetical protein
MGHKSWKASELQEMLKERWDDFHELSAEVNPPKSRKRKAEDGDDGCQNKKVKKGPKARRTPSIMSDDESEGSGPSLNQEQNVPKAAKLDANAQPLLQIAPQLLRECSARVGQHYSQLERASDLEAAKSEGRGLHQVAVTILDQIQHPSLDSHPTPSHSDSDVTNQEEVSDQDNAGQHIEGEEAEQVQEASSQDLLSGTDQPSGKDQPSDEHLTRDEDLPRDEDDLPPEEEASADHGEDDDYY